jgi:hypothetical protein
MENKIKKSLNDYLNLTDKSKNNENTNQNDNIQLTEKDGLIERLNKKFLIEDGRELLND